MHFVYFKIATLGIQYHLRDGYTVQIQLSEYFQTRLLVREPLWGWEMWKTVGLDWSRFPESGRCLSCHVSLCTCGSTYPHITTYAPARVAPWSSDTFPLDQVEETSLKLTLSKLAGRYWQKYKHFVFRHQGISEVCSCERLK